MRFGIVVGALLGAGCSTAASPTGAGRGALKACDPLTVGASPIALANVIGAGRAADGTVYVLDQIAPNGTSGEPRAFVSRGTVLQRVKVDGSGSGADFVTVSIGSATPAELQIRVETTNGVATRMGVFRGAPDPRTKSFDLGVQGEQLTLLGAGELNAFTVANLTDIYVMYDATTADGHRFIAFSTSVDYDDSKLRVFYGTDDRLAQRRVLSVSYDSSVHLTFDLDGVATLAQLQYRNSWYGWGEPRLEPAAGGGPKIPMTPAPGSPGADWQVGYEQQNGLGDGGLGDGGLGDGGLGDGGLGDGGLGDSSSVPKDPAELTRGLSFQCF